jgi:hypothetical protein
MSTYKRQKLSGSTDGKGIKVAASAIGSGTIIHTASATTTAGLGDLVTLFAYNSDTVGRMLTLGWGGTTSPDDLIDLLLQPKGGGLILVVADLLLMNSLVIKAAGDAANVITIHGYANVIS